MAETNASSKILQKYQVAFSADVFSFSAKNVTCEKRISTGFDTGIHLYSELL